MQQCSILCSLLYVAFVVMFRHVTQTLQKDLLYTDSLAGYITFNYTFHCRWTHQAVTHSGNNKMTGLFERCDL